MTEYAPALEICCCGECEAKGHPKEVVRDLTPEEIAQREADRLAFEAEQEQRQTEAEAKAAAKEAAHAKLAALGLTADEIAALS